MILVTGGTGLVGSHLLYQLSKTEGRVRAIYRNRDKIQEVKKVFTFYADQTPQQFEKIEWVCADLNDLQALSQALEGISLVYHAAALVSFDPRQYYQLRKVNIEGTANVVNLCLSKKIKKLCYVSSIATLGEPLATSSITEGCRWNADGDHSVYAITKYGAEMEVWRGIQEGLPAVIVNPGIILGAGFWKTGSGSLFRMVHKGMKYYTEGVVGFVDVRDVVRAMILLMHSNHNGLRYIIVSENTSYRSFFEQVAKVLGVAPPNKKIRKPMLQVLWRIDWLRCLLIGKRRKLTRHTVVSLTTKNYYSNEKIKKELSFEFTPIQQSIKEVSAAYRFSQGVCANAKTIAPYSKLSITDILLRNKSKSIT